MPGTAGQPGAGRRGGIVPLLWALAAKTLAMVLTVYVIWSSIDAVPSLWREASLSPAVAMLLMLALIAAVSLWLAWRLLTDWSAATVRLVLGVAVGIGLAVAWVEIAVRATQAGFPYGRTFASMISLLGVIIGAILYRKVTRWVIRSAQLDDPLDIHGQPAGHMNRVRLFCTVLGGMIVFTGIHVGGDARDAGAAWIALGASAVLAPIAYHLTLWWMTPRTYQPLPAGGFEVLPASANTADDSNPAD